MEDNIGRCLDAFRAAANDTERFAALMLIAKLVSPAKCDSKARQKIASTIGFEFIGRLLRTEDVPTGCPKYIFRGIALTLMACFASTVSTCEEVEKSKLFEQVPYLLQLLEELTDGAATNTTLTTLDKLEEQSDKKRMLFDILQCLFDITEYSIEGCQAVSRAQCCNFIPVLFKLIDNNLNMNQVAVPNPAASTTTTTTDDLELKLAFNIIANVNQILGDKIWWRDSPSPASQFQIVADKLARFAGLANGTATLKFGAICAMTAVIHNMPKCLLMEDNSWLASIQNELLRIERTRLWYSYKRECLLLLSALVDTLGIEKALIRQDVNQVNERFELLQITVRLACIEIQLTLEGQTLAKAVGCSDDAIASFIIVELAIGYLIDEDSVPNINNALELNSFRDCKQNIYHILTQAFESVLHFLSQIEDTGLPPSSNTKINTSEEWQFLQGVTRILGAWLAEETEALHEKVYAVFPILLRLAEADDVCFRFLLPGLCHLSVEDDCRKILMENCAGPRMLMGLLQRLWESEKLRDASDVHTSMITASGVLLNIIVLESDAVAKERVFLDLLRFLFQCVLEMDRERARYSQTLLGHATVMGLLILRRVSHKLKPSDASIYRFLSASVRFLWDAFSVDDSRDLCSLVVSLNYRPSWEELRELWFLGLQTLCSLLPDMPWVGAFLIESGWGADVMRSLARVKAINIDPSVKVAFEDLLVHLVRSNGEVGSNAASTLRECGAMTVCDIHGMGDLKAALQDAFL